MEKPIELQVNDLEHDVKELDRRISACEEQQKTLLELTTSVKEISINVKYMYEEQQKQGKRLELLEKAPAETAKHFKYAIISAVASLIVGGVGGAILALVVK